MKFSKDCKDPSVLINLLWSEFTCMEWTYLNAEYFTTLPHSLTLFSSFLQRLLPCSRPFYHFRILLLGDMVCQYHQFLRQLPGFHPLETRHIVHLSLLLAEFYNYRDLRATANVLRKHIGKKCNIVSSGGWMLKEEGDLPFQVEKFFVLFSSLFLQAPLWYSLCQFVEWSRIEFSAGWN